MVATPAGSSRRNARAMLTAGLKCAPDIGPNVRMSTVKIAPVGRGLQRSVSAPLPPASFAAMIPEPTTPAHTRSRLVAPAVALGSVDFFELLFQAQSIERAQRQRRENSDALIEH